MKKRSLLIFVALALVPLILLAQISSPGSYASVIMTFLRSTTAAAARSAIGAADSGSGGSLTNATIYGSTSGNLTMTSDGKIGIGTTVPSSVLHAFKSVSDFRFSEGSGSITPTISVISTSGKAAALLAGAAGAGFVYDSSGTFSLLSESKSSITNNTAGSGTAQMTLTTGFGFGFGTTGPEKKVDINSATGACLQLTYNDNNGSAANKVTFDVSSGGDLTVAPSGSDASFTGRLASTPTSSTLAAAATAIAVTANVMTITGDTGANTVATITGGLSGQILTLIFVDSLVTITDDATGNANTVNLSAAFTSTSNDTLTLVFNGTSWREVARSVN